MIVEEEGPLDDEVDISCSTLVPSALCVNFARVLKTLVEPCSQVVLGDYSECYQISIFQ